MLGAVLAWLAAAWSAACLLVMSADTAPGTWLVVFGIDLAFVVAAVVAVVVDEIRWQRSR